MTERAYPHSLDTERAVLGTCIAEPSLMADTELSPDDFYRHDHRELWALMQQMDGEGTPPDMVNLPMTVERLGSERFGGFAYVLDLTHYAQHVLHSSHIKRVKQDATRRRMLAALDAARESMAIGLTDPDEVVLDLDERIEAARLGAADGTRTVTLHHAMQALYESKANPPPQLRTVSTGFRLLDDLITGLGGGEQVILAAGTGEGKTSFALELAWNVAWRGHAALVFTTEMDDMHLAARIWSARSGLRESVVKAPLVSTDVLDELHRGVVQAEGMELYIHDQPGVSIAQVRRAARRAAHEAKATGGRLGLVVVDYLQRMSLPQERGETRSRAVGQASRELKNLARELDCCVLTLSQLSRAAKDSAKPELWHLRDSGEIEQDADIVLMLRYERQHAVQKVYVAKQRSGASNEMVPLLWEPGRNPAWSEATGPALRQIRHMLGEG